MEATTVRRDRRGPPRPPVSARDMYQIRLASRLADERTRVSTRFAFFAIGLELAGVLALVLWVALA